MSVMLTIFLSINLALASITNAELRDWHDQAGNSFHAQYKILFGRDQVILQDTKGKTLKVKIRKLSKEDQSYIQLMNPPKLDLRCSVTEELTGIELNKTKKGHQSKSKWLVKVSASMKYRMGKIAYSHSPKLDIYLLSRGDDGYVKLHSLLSKSTSFNGSNKKGELDFEFKDVTMISAQEIYVLNGTRRHSFSGDIYHGFLAVVTDSRGTILSMDYTDSSIKKISQKITKAKAGDPIYKWRD